MSKHLIHKKSNELIDGKAKLPLVTDIEHGELAINYTKGQETLALKNSNDEIISLPFGGSGDYVAKSGDTMSGNLNILASLNVGMSNMISGQYSMAQGFGCVARGFYSYAQGTNSAAIGGISHAEGYMTTASGQGSHSEGKETKAIGECSHTEGVYTIASGSYSHAEGNKTTANNLSEHANGSYNVSISGTNQSATALTVDSQATLFSIGNGYPYADGSTWKAKNQNAFEVKWNGDTYFSGNTSISKTLNVGSGNTVTGLNAFAQGSGCTASGEYAHAQGRDCSASGIWSHAEGVLTKAIGVEAHAEGSWSKANGDCSHAEGYSTTANNYSEHASGNFNVSTSGTSQVLSVLVSDDKATLFSIGNGHNDATRKNAFEVKYNGDTYISGNTSISKTLNVGSGNTVTRQYAFAQGTTCTASGEASHAEGVGTIASDKGSHAEGETTKALGFYSHAQGSGCIASGYASHAEGQSTRASGSYSHAEGAYTIANNLGEHSNGSYNVSISGTNPNLTALTNDSQATLFSIGNGYSNGSIINRQNAFEVKYNGDTYVSRNINIGSGNTFTSTDSAGTVSNATCAFAQGWSCKASGWYSHASGWYTIASGRYSHAEGDSTRASGEGSHAEGSGCTASTIASHAEGRYTTASGNISHAEGIFTKAIGEGSHAEGYSTTANGKGSHAEGSQTRASGESSHAEGGIVPITNGSGSTRYSHTSANGRCSHAEGGATTTNGEYSHAEGQNTIANNRAEHASGAYNISTSGVNQDITALTANTQATLFSIGNGYEIYGSREIRKNAFEVKWNGDTYISGDTKFAKGITANTISSPTIDAKQDVLVSSTNIKTINGESLLGSGDLLVNIASSLASNLVTKQDLEDFKIEIKAYIDSKII